MTQNYSISAKEIVLQLNLSKGFGYRKYSCSQEYELVSLIEHLDTQCHTLKLNCADDTSIIELATFGKTDKDTVLQDDQIVRDQTLSVEQVYINGVQIENWALAKMSQFRHDYTKSQIQWAQHNGNHLPEFSNQLCFYTNGVWSLNLQQPFFLAYNKILFEHLGYVNQWVREWHLGIPLTEDVERLQVLMEQAGAR
jgi:hypothetical protein